MRFKLVVLEALVGLHNIAVIVMVILQLSLW